MTGGDPTDEALAALAGRGDERAFSQLVVRHKESLYRLLRRYTGDRDEAYEAVHETFIAAWAALGRYDAARAFGPWLRTIAINKARDRGRRMAVRRFFFGGGEDDLASAVDPGLAADDTLQQRQVMELLDQAVARLPEALKAPLLLTAFEGLSQHEAAAILGVSAKSIETRVYRARKALAMSLDPAVLRIDA
ncbi:RNA polymerase sigma factor [Caulobacter sp. DWR2-3-1b2]|uniref:RNA polymerase sigma factor n=1 Tax=unclassified Caulobacter TaxID=2648921 RepID=UPI0019A14618|nr:RNA polymerase sigma factor [Caulobacter sp.]